MIHAELGYVKVKGSKGILLAELGTIMAAMLQEDDITPEELKRLIDFTQEELGDTESQGIKIDLDELIKQMQENETNENWF